MVVLPIDGMNTVEWSRRGEPFPHTIARDVFSKEFYGGMDRQFQAILDRGLSEMPAYGQLMRMSEYDAYGISFDQTLTGYLSIFISQAWHNLLTSLFHVNGTGHVYVGAHHHKCGSTGGKIRL